MNWRRGLKRLWIVSSALWIAISGTAVVVAAKPTLLPPPIQIQFDDGEVIQYPGSMPEEEIIKKTTLFVAEKYKHAKLVKQTATSTPAPPKAGFDPAAAAAAPATPSEYVFDPAAELGAIRLTDAQVKAYQAEQQAKTRALPGTATGGFDPMAGRGVPLTGAEEQADDIKIATEQIRRQVENHPTTLIDILPYLAIICLMPPAFILVLGISLFWVARGLQE